MSKSDASNPGVDNLGKEKTQAAKWTIEEIQGKMDALGERIDKLASCLQNRTPVFQKIEDFELLLSRIARAVRRLGGDC